LGELSQPVKCHIELHLLLDMATPALLTYVEANAVSRHALLHGRSAIGRMTERDRVRKSPSQKQLQAGIFGMLDSTHVEMVKDGRIYPEAGIPVL
jgi:hypothetical protein